MANLHKSLNDVDLEAANINGGGNDGGGHVLATDISVGDSSISSNGNDHSTSSPCGSEIVGVSENTSSDDSNKRRESNVSDCSVEVVVVDLKDGPSETRLHLAKIIRDCRICHLSLDAANQDSGLPIELGCSCKGDLAAAHNQCAEAWFKIKGNKTCEICGSIARNVSCVNEAVLIEQWNEANYTAATAMTPASPAASHNFWQGRRFLNFLLACMVFAFVISWLFHFNVRS
ncbi:E3 ubiquitin- ligase MARCH8-like [Olea europaea subsp. europaea]|uniref:E3 ubiquitin- ligase MARCH8-like n=1 Tax=Olea europaea subsp. europaea TaxID=158383 RepID=A0A8S0QZ57_OLEEU|nr:E3 ubiquitin- ligase MARCH8-like [Olea europaea subsp. europaea]